MTPFRVTQNIPSSSSIAVFDNSVPKSGGLKIKSSLKRLSLKTAPTKLGRSFYFKGPVIKLEVTA